VTRIVRTLALIVAALIGVLARAPCARAIDFYEIEIYDTETTAPGHLQLELHSNTVNTATGAQAKAAMNPYQIHETLEATYGLLRWLEIGQYLATAKFENGDYEYAGSRTKMHFGIPQTFDWAVKFGGNVELDYMRFAAEENPFTLELRPILETSFGKFTLVGNLAFVDPFSGPGAHKGFQFSPSGEIEYDLCRWATPALEYYGDMGALKALPSVERQQHFIVPTVNLHIVDNLELNLGIGFGLTRTSNGTFLKSIVGWTF
jgi:hypothetical protein